MKLLTKALEAQGYMQRVAEAAKPATKKKEA